jgi:hypothetical protein
MIAKVHPAPDGGPEQDQGEVGEQQQRGMHRRILWSAVRLPKHMGGGPA